MSNIIKSSSLLNRQPAGKAVVNWSNPLTRGLIFAHIPSAGWFDSVGNKYPVSGSAAISAWGGINGENTDTLSSTNYKAFDIDGKIVDAYTVLTICTPDSLSNATQGSFINANAVDGNGAGFKTNVASTPRFLHYTAANTATALTPSYTLAIGTRYVLSGVWDGTNLAYYIDGILKSTGSASVLYGKTRANVGGYFAGAYSSGSVSCSLVFNRALTASEVKSLSINPWQVFRRHRAFADGAIVTSTTDQTISCTVGNAVADGATASLNRTIVATVGNAVADGATASLNRTISCTVGNAVADGATADIGLGVVINCTVGNAEANGSTATILNLGEEILGGGGFAFWADRVPKKPTKKEKKKIAKIIEEAEELVFDNQFNRLTNKRLDKYTSMLASVEEILTTRQKQRVQYIQQSIQQQQQKRKYMIYASAALLT